MAIVCTGCGREYDVTLFQLGRTIHCTCGRRVGLEHRLTLPGDETGPRDAATPRDAAGRRFIADAMLGNLARWLRTLGHDTAYDDAIADDELVRRAFDEDRHILTRDRNLFQEWRVEGLLVEADETLEQLREVVDAFELPRPDELFTRCRECNEVLEPADLSDVEDRVPERVLVGSPAVARCPGCGRVYWEGSHTERMRRVVDRVFEG